MNKKTYVKLSIAIIVLVVILRFALAVTQNVSGDACWHLSVSRYIADNGKIPLFEGLGRLQPFWAPPIFHFISAFMYKITVPFGFGLADLSSRLVSPIFGTLTVIILFLITRKMFDEKTAFYSMIFINFVPLFIDYSIFSYVGSTITLFSILSIYFMINSRYVLSSVSFGVAILSKYNAIFIFPMLIYLVYKLSPDKKERLVRVLTVVLLPLAISSIWFLRNFILLGNPFWPFFNDIFHGIMVGVTFNTTDFAPLFSLGTYFKSYVEIYGIPNGNLALFSFLNFPLLKFFLFIWLIGTLIFTYPFIRGFFGDHIKGNKKKIFLKSIYIAFLSFLFMLILYVLSLGWFGSRLLLPVIPFMGIIWALGLKKIKMEKIYLVIILFICLGFVVAEVVKIEIAKKSWEPYSKDFEWVEINTANEDLFFGNGQCLSYNIDRLVINHKVDIDFNQIDYVWVNNDWKIDFHMNEKTLSEIKTSDKLEEIYSNSDTGTVIYKVKQ